ncbi:MAG: TonB-dependent receptor domain-containing protein, partial [Burkholderiales bacterium]
YADDSWAMTDWLTVNAGLRFDLNSGDIPEMPVLDASRSEVGTAEAVKNLVDWKTISPRLGVNLKLREPSTVMRASYGRYYQGVTTNIYSALSPARAATPRCSESGPTPTSA